MTKAFLAKLFQPSSCTDYLQTTSKVLQIAFNDETPFANNNLADFWQKFWKK